MSIYAFIELPPPMDSWIDAPETLFPVRASEAEALQQQETPQPERILFELERYLEENPPSSRGLPDQARNWHFARRWSCSRRG